MKPGRILLLRKESFSFNINGSQQRKPNLAAVRVTGNRQIIIHLCQTLSIYFFQPCIHVIINWLMRHADAEMLIHIKIERIKLFFLIIDSRKINSPFFSII